MEKVYWCTRIKSIYMRVDAEQRCVLVEFTTSAYFYLFFLTHNKTTGEIQRVVRS